MVLHDIGIIRSLEEIIFVAEQMGENERLAVGMAMGFLQGMRERRRTRGGSYGGVPDRGNYPSISRFARRSEKGVRVVGPVDSA